MNESGAVYLPDSAAAYVDWFQAHPAGYVINAHKTGSFPMFWHRVGCGHIRPDGEVRFSGNLRHACFTRHYPGVYAPLVYPPAIHGRPSASPRPRAGEGAGGVGAASRARAI